MKKFFGKIFSWIKENPVTTILLVVVIYLLLPKRQRFFQEMNMVSSGRGGGFDMTTESLSMGKSIGIPAPTYDAAPRPDVADRKVITSSSMSLQVKNVRNSIENIKSKVSELGGYVVETNVTTPEFGEDGSIVVRVPADSLDSTLEYFRELAVKVVSENISGTDITDEYIDIEERIDRLEKTKTRFEEILDEAQEVEDILNVQRQIFNIQDQIDSYKGRLQYMEGASDTTLIRVYLSTDELGLPYAPSQAWRPAVVFKQATRSLLLNMVKLGNAAIWVAVYAPTIAAAAVIYFLVRKIAKSKKPSSQK